LCIAKVAIPSVGERARTRAGGVSPPWFTKQRFERRFDSHSPATDTRGRRKPPWLRQRDRNSVRQHAGGSLPSNCGSAFASASPRHTAGSRPPLLALRGTSVSEYARNRAGHTITGHTAGSRPPLLVRVRLCIAKVAIPPANARVAICKSGGRKPPVVRETGLGKTIRFRFNAGPHNSGCGNAIATASANSPAAVCRAIAVTSAGVRQRAAGRAYARRSWCTSFARR